MLPESVSVTKSMRDALDPAIFRLTIMPTEKCNFRCSYCYEDFKIGRMSPETQRRLVVFLEKRVSPLRSLHISWFGGEPLLAKDIVLNLSSRAFAICAQNDTKYSSSMTTNGFLLDQTTQTSLASVGVKRFQISLDGPPEAHNSTRRSLKRNPTYDQIWNNLLALKASTLDVQCVLRLHITSLNLELFEAWSEEVRNVFSTDTRFSFRYEVILDHGGEHFEINSVPPRREAYYLKSQLVKRHTPVATESKRIDSVCYAASPNAYVLRANGKLAKCTVHFGSDSNTIGFLSEAGDFIVDRHKIGKWSQGFRSGDQNALQCPAHFLNLTH